MLKKKKSLLSAIHISLTFPMKFDSESGSAEILCCTMEEVKSFLYLGVQNFDSGFCYFPGYIMRICGKRLFVVPANPPYCAWNMF